ncbi:hypothetical protein [Rhodococcus sp. NPDC127528]|uniref:hypothetical protein n=1 Tax=unclassified Rhodococcus (in: high G+C Gram-positive bacteria) TaxID=192944 RepID=UPI003643ECC8
MITQASLDRARAVADAVLYEGYLLYPYRASSRKNQSRWQFGVLGPPGAEAAGAGEDPRMSSEFLLQPTANAGGCIHITLRFLQLQVRDVERAESDGTFTPVEMLTTGGTDWLSWDEAVEREVALDRCTPGELSAGRRIPVRIDGGTDVESLQDATGSIRGRVIRTRRPLQAEVEVRGERHDGLWRLHLEVANTGSPVTATDAEAEREAIRRSLIGAHLVVAAEDGRFVSLLEPADAAADAAAACRQHRCFPVLAGRPGDTGLVLVSPIILYDYPEVAEQSEGALFDSSEIDEILTLRVLTLTDEEKAQARATDPLAAAIVDRCEQLTPESMTRMHGILRDPGSDAAPVPEFAGTAPWWDPEQDSAVRPDTDAVVVDGVAIAKGSLVRVRPSRRADAQDLFYAGRTARVTAVLSDVDGGNHVGVVLVDDPAADMHDWYGRYLYFAPDELEPLGRNQSTGRESRP